MDGLQIRNIVKTYGKSNVLNDVSINIERGEFVSLLGESGSGKSTLSKLIIGIEKPTSGEIILDGENVCKFNYHQWRKRRSKIQAVFQDTSGTLNPALSVYRNMEEALINLSNLDKTTRRNRINELMELTGIDRKILEVPVRGLSGGESRRVSLLRALAIRPDYLVLDEVISGLDLISSDSVLSVLERYHAEYSCACLFVTHDIDSAYRISDRILKISNGLIIKEGRKIPNTERKLNYENETRHNCLYSGFDNTCVNVGLLQ